MKTLKSPKKGMNEKEKTLKQKKHYKMDIAKNWREILEKSEENMTKQEKEDLSKRYHKTFEARQE